LKAEPTGQSLKVTLSEQSQKSIILDDFTITAREFKDENFWVQVFIISIYDKFLHFSGILNF